MQGRTLGRFDHLPSVPRADPLQSGVPGRADTLYAVQDPKSPHSSFLSLGSGLLHGLSSLAHWSPD